MHKWLTHPAMIYLSLVLAFFLNLWGLPLFDVDEGAFSEATREMLASGNFAATYLDGLPRYDKPIFSYWCQAISASMFGINEFSLRLPSAIAACLWMWACYCFIREQNDKHSAVLVVLVMCHTLWIGLIGRAAIADAWLNLFLSLCMFDIWRYWQQPRQTVIVRVFVWMGLGVLTKGPVAILIPLLTSGIFFISKGQGRLWLLAIFNPLGWAAVLLVLSPWLYLVYQDQGLAFFQGFLIDHNLNRFQHTKEGHGGQLYYYFLVLPLILLPFSGALVGTIKRVKLLWQSPLDQFLMLWFLIVFALVSVSQTQLPHYVVYGVTGLLLVMVRHRQVVFQPWSAWLPVLFWLLMLALPQIVMTVANNTHHAYEKALLSRTADIFSTEYYLLCALCLVFALFLASRSKWPALTRLVFLGALQSLFVFNVLLVRVAELQQVPVKEAAIFARSYPADAVVSFKINMPSFSVYRQHITPEREALPGDLIFTRADRFEQLQHAFPNESLTIVFSKGGILLVERPHASNS